MIGSDDMQQVGHRDHPEKMPEFFRDQQVKDAVFLHQAQAFIERIVRPHHEQVPRHDLRNPHPGWAFVLRRYFV